MPRSVKKGPFLDYKLAEKIKKLNKNNQKKIKHCCEPKRSYPVEKMADRRKPEIFEKPCEDVRKEQKQERYFVDDLNARI